MSTADQIARARTAFARRAWTDAFEAFRGADEDGGLDLDDLERAGLAAHLIGRDEEAIGLWSRAHHIALAAGEVPRAARRAFWLGMMLSQRGDLARGGGWLGRANRLIDEWGADCVEHGYVFIPEALGRIQGGDHRGALELFERAVAVAERFGDADLGALGRLGRGRSLMGIGELARGISLLDEAMLAVIEGEVSPVIVGIVYCAAIEGYQETFELRRAQEWTAALSAWCEAQPDLVPFRGRCLVYRAEVMRWHGEWRQAIDEARRAEAWLSRPPPEPAVGEAVYEQAELHRLRGEHDLANEAYRQASRWGRSPEPGLALLRLAEGDRAGAAAMIRRAVDETIDEMARARLLEPQVEIALAVDDPIAARAAADDLDRIASGSVAPALGAMSARALGSVLLAEGDPRAALGILRRSAATWQELGVPYESARARVVVGLALRALGDAEAADLELDAARRAFGELGAAPDLARLDALIGRAGPRDEGLSKREAEVLRLVASGLTNRAIAAELGISERTVDRHVSNIFIKLEVSSRAAATAFAYEHGLR